MSIIYLKNKTDSFELYKIKSKILASSLPTDKIEKLDIDYFRVILKKIDNDEFKLTYHEISFLIKAPVIDWAPYILHRFRFRQLADKKIKTKFPPYLLIEPTSICNLRCVMCFQTDKSFGNNKSFMGRMDLNLFKKIIDEAVYEGCKAITFASRGDPTLNKDLSKMLDYTKGKFIEVKLNTNGVLLDDKLSRCILRNEVTDLVFSIDSYEKQNYENIRKKAKFDNVLNNIKQFMDIRTKEFKFHRTTVRVSGVRLNEKQNYEKFNKFWLEHVDYCSLTQLQERWDVYQNDVLPNDRLLACGDLFERMYIWWDGTVNPCDVDYKSTLAVGNVKIETIKEIWNGKRYEELREDHLNNKRGNHDVCAKCDWYVK